MFIRNIQKTSIKALDLIKHSQSTTHFSKTTDSYKLSSCAVSGLGCFVFSQFLSTSDCEKNKDIELGVTSDDVLHKESREELFSSGKRFDIVLEDGFKPKFEAMIKDAQDRICEAISKVDGKSFVIDDWERTSGGGGRTRVLQDGNVFEKGGVNVSVVHGRLPPKAVQMMKAEHKSLDNIFLSSDIGTSDGLPFYACGLSLVIHPHNPKAPTVHLNYRFFEVVNPTNGESLWWFGGGSDLTPSYLFEEDAILFHQVLKDACDKLDPTFYAKYKKECDDYFLIKHRNERRGIGGIFFDDLDEVATISKCDVNGAEMTKERIMAFQKDCLDGFIKSYVEIMNKRKDMAFTEEQKRWQQLRRGRYVEFNLVYDRGTKFGLYTPNARIESILMSLPLTCRYEYNHKPELESEEGKMLEVLIHPKDWIQLNTTVSEK